MRWRLLTVYVHRTMKRSFRAGVRHLGSYLSFATIELEIWARPFPLSYLFSSLRDLRS